MTSPEHDPSIHAEPHHRNAFPASQADEAEEKVARQLAAERAGTDPDEERATHSVFDEPGTLPNRQPALIDQDWICRKCGYNLRGLMTGHKCPECGAVEHFEPPREGELTHAKWLAEHKSHPSMRRSWLIVILICVAGAPLGAVCTFLLIEVAGFLSFVVFGPVVAEVAKLAGSSLLVERDPHLIRTRGQVYAMAIGTAVAFAAAQNLAYLLVVFKNSPAELVAWRWTVSMVLHGGCTFLAARGLVASWEASRLERRRPRLSRAYPAVVVAIIVHSAYNACVFVLGHAGYGF